MPLPISSVERELRHTRRVRYEGYKRGDGLWDIEAHLTDLKNHDFHLKTGVRRAGLEEEHGGGDSRTSAPPQVRLRSRK